MNRRTMTVALSCGAAALIGFWAIGALKAQQPGFKRVELHRHDVGHGHEVVQARAEFDPGASIGKHTHPGEEFGYVLEGALELEIAGKPTATLKAGETFFVPPSTVRTIGCG